MEALLGLSSLLGIILSFIFLLYCLIKRNENIKVASWLIVLFIGLLSLALGFYIFSAILLAISIFKLVKDPSSKERVHEHQKKHLERQIEEQKKNNELINLQAELAEQKEQEQYTISHTESDEQINQEIIKIDTLINQVDPVQVEEKKAGLFHQGVFCPYCRSLDVVFMQNNKKGFSVGKAVGGAALTGGIGTLAGFAGKKGKNQWHCQNCKKTFTSKK